MVNGKQQHTFTASPQHDVTAAHCFMTAAPQHHVTAAHCFMTAAPQHDVTAAHCLMTATLQNFDIVLNAMRSQESR